MRDSGLLASKKTARSLDYHLFLFVYTTVAEAQKQHLWPALTSDIWTLKLKSCYETRSRYAWFSIFRDVAVLGANSEISFYEYQQ